MIKIVLGIALLFASFGYADAQTYNVGTDKDGDMWFMNTELSKTSGQTVFAAVELTLNDGASMAVLVEFDCKNNKMQFHKSLLFIRGVKITEEKLRKGYIKPFNQFIGAYDISCKAVLM